MTLEEIIAGIRESIANARPDLRRDRPDLLEGLEAACAEGHPQKIMAILERLDIVNHYPAARRPDGGIEPQPMPGGWTSWHGWMMRLKAWEEAPYFELARRNQTPDIPEDELLRSGL